MNNFLYQPEENEQKKYTLDDLNQAVEDDGNGGGESVLGGGVWGSVANAAKTGNTTEMQQKLAKLSEMKQKQSAQFQQKQMINRGGQAPGSQHQNGGLISLDQMNLDRPDDSQNYDPFYNPINGGTYTAESGIELKAQNQYMDKETAQRQSFWSPENQEAAKSKEQEVQRDELDDLEEIEDMGSMDQPQQRNFQPQNYPEQKPEIVQDQETKQPQFRGVIATEVDNDTQQQNAAKKKKKKKKKAEDMMNKINDQLA